MEWRNTCRRSDRPTLFHRSWNYYEKRVGQFDKQTLKPKKPLKNVLEKSHQNKKKQTNKREKINKNQNKVITKKFFENKWKEF